MRPLPARIVETWGAGAAAAASGEDVCGEVTEVAEGSGRRRERSRRRVRAQPSAARTLAGRSWRSPRGAGSGRGCCRRGGSREGRRGGAGSECGRCRGRLRWRARAQPPPARTVAEGTGRAEELLLSPLLPIRRCAALLRRRATVLQLPMHPPSRRGQQDEDGDGKKCDREDGNRDEVTLFKF